MASDSSAVLELQDDDGDDASIMSSANNAELAPLIMEHGADIAVKVDAPMKQLSTLETFVTYRVRCVCARWPTPPFVRRRFNHFKELHRRMTGWQPWVPPPPLPASHSARQQLDRYHAAFVASRASALHAFLDRIAKHPLFTHNEDFRLFLTTPDEEIDKVFKNESSALNLMWGLSSALHSSGENKSSNGPRVKDPEFSAATDYLLSLEQKLNTLSKLISKLNKGNVELASEYKDLATTCSVWASSDKLAGAAAIGHVTGGRVTARGHVTATLPWLAVYAREHVRNIRQRDKAHAAYVSGGNNNDELHNRLEQASEAIRSELQDWTHKTQNDVKAILGDVADQQIAIYQQTLAGWEHALKLSSETNMAEVFKLVSKTAVQNLSPTKYRNDIGDDSVVVDDLDLEISDSDELVSRELENGDEIKLDGPRESPQSGYQESPKSGFQESPKSGYQESPRSRSGSQELSSPSKEATWDPLHQFSDIDLTDT